MQNKKIYDYESVDFQLKKNNKLYGIIYILCVIIAVLLVKCFNIKINLSRYIEPAWVSGFATAIAILFSVILLFWQLHQGTVDRRRDAQTIFSITWIRNTKAQENVWIHKEIFDKYKNCEHKENIKTTKGKILLIKNVGSKVAQEVLIKLEMGKNKEYFSRMVMEKNYEFMIIPDLLFDNSQSEDIDTISIYYLSELGQRICFEYCVEEKTVNTSVIKNWNKLREKFVNTNIISISYKVI